jgi:hypothetical protein
VGLKRPRILQTEYCPAILPPGVKATVLIMSDKQDRVLPVGAAAQGANYLGDFALTCANIQTGVLVLAQVDK